MLRKLARASVITGTLGVLFSCSDPVPPSAKAALENTIQSGANCPAAHPPLSIGDEGAAIKANGGGDRATNGKGGASVSCAIVKTDSGFNITGSLKANTMQENFETGQPYFERFEIKGSFPGFAPGTGGKAEIFTNDTYTQRGYTDSNCTVTVKSLGEDNEGGAIWATFDCENFADPGTPESQCRLVGTIVFENCEK